MKLIGDEAMFLAPVGRRPRRASRWRCAGPWRRDDALPAARGAVGYGTVGARDGDYFGTAREPRGPGRQGGRARIGRASPKPCAADLDHSPAPDDDFEIVELLGPGAAGIDEPVRLFALRCGGGPPRVRGSQSSARIL